jgi:hypothetical protein
LIQIDTAESEKHDRSDTRLSKTAAELAGKLLNAEPLPESDAVNTGIFAAQREMFYTRV